MVERENLEASREIWTALNAHDMDRWAKLLDEGFLWQTDTLGAPVSGREAARRTMQAYFTGFPRSPLDDRAGVRQRGVRRDAMVGDGPPPG